MATLSLCREAPDLGERCRHVDDETKVTYSGRRSRWGQCVVRAYGRSPSPNGDVVREASGKKMAQAALACWLRTGEMPPGRRRAGRGTRSANCEPSRLSTWQQRVPRAVRHALRQRAPAMGKQSLGPGARGLCASVLLAEPRGSVRAEHWVWTALESVEETHLLQREQRLRLVLANMFAKMQNTM